MGLWHCCLCGIQFTVSATAISLGIYLKLQTDNFFGIMLSYREYKSDMGLFSYRVSMKNDEHAKNLLSYMWFMRGIVFGMLFNALCGIFNLYCFSIFILSKQVPLPLHKWIRRQFTLNVFAQSRAPISGKTTMLAKVYSVISHLGEISRLSRIAKESRLRAESLRQSFFAPPRRRRPTGYVPAYISRRSFSPASARSRALTTDSRASYIIGVAPSGPRDWDPYAI